MTPSPTRRFWRRFVTFGFRLLYNEMAWLYDPVSWVVSLGRWRRWQQTALAFLPAGGRVLEVGSGPGHLLADLHAAGHTPTGIDLSRAMIRQAGRRLRRKRLPASLCRGNARTLPFAAGAFDGIVVTFPTPYVYDPLWIRQARRVLRPGGRLVVVEMATFPRKSPATRGLEWLYGITGQRGPAPDLAAALRAEGLDARHEMVQVDDTSTRLVVAEVAG